MIADIALSLELLEPRVTARLIELYGSAGAIYAATPSDLIGRAQLGQRAAYALSQKRFHTRAEAEVHWAQQNGIHILTPVSPDYPPLLREVGDRPHVLYLQGDPAILQAPMIAMVGTRRITTYGLMACNRLVEEIAERMPDAVIVSGLAFGVDIACHRAALAHGLRTIAVMATPIHQTYPTVHRAVAEEMVARGGGLVTELSSQSGSSKQAFLKRNRIVAGMCAATVVVQSPDHGGSMVTAAIADSYDRPLMAPPGPINEPKCEGTNRLLRTLRARMVCSGSDILTELGWLPQETPTRSKPSAPQQHGTEKQLYDIVCANPQIPLEQLEATTGIPSQQLLTTLLELEFAGHIRTLPGNKYERFR